MFVAVSVNSHSTCNKYRTHRRTCHMNGCLHAGQFLYIAANYFYSLSAVTLPSYRISGYIHAIWPPTGSSPLHATSQPSLLTVKANHVHIKPYRFLPRSSSSSPRYSFRYAGVQSSRRPARARPRPFVYKHPIEPSQQHLDANDNFYSAQHFYWQQQLYTRSEYGVPLAYPVSSWFVC